MDKKKKESPYERVKTYTPEEILPLISLRDRRKNNLHTLDGYVIKTNTPKCQVFKQKGLTCTRCGLKGTFFALERQILDAKNFPHIRYHLNLYGINKKGEEILFTKDHIIPLAKSGPNNLSNLQPMCSVCNNRKADNLHPITLAFLPLAQQIRKYRKIKPYNLFRAIKDKKKIFVVFKPNAPTSLRITWGSSKEQVQSKFHGWNVISIFKSFILFFPIIRNGM